MTTKAKAAKPAKKRVAKQKAKTAPAPAEKKYALVIRTCNANMTSRYDGKFLWPVSGPVECSDWSPDPSCGHGLHGLLWGHGDWQLLDNSIDAKWLVVKVAVDEVVAIDKQKVRFPRGEVVYCGNMAEAAAMVLCHKDAMADAGNVARGNWSNAASSGDSSTAASSGNWSTAASSGDWSKAASSGDSSTAASSGDSSMAASSGDSSMAASSGDWSKAVAIGSNTIAAVAGTGGMAAAGENGCFALAYHDGSRNRFAVGIVGENGIRANTWYAVADKSGRLEERGLAEPGATP